MRKQITVVFLLCVFLMTGCDDTNSTEVQQTLSSEQTEEALSEEVDLEEINELGEITTEQKNVHEKENIEVIILEEVVPVEEIVYEENDVVFVIAKRFSHERGDIEYGYLISVGGKVVPFEISFEEFFSDEVGADHGNILDMKVAEPIMELEDEVIKYYIEKFKNVDESKEMDRQFHGYDYEYERVSIYGRRVDCNKKVDSVEIYSLDNCILEPTDPNAIELKDWLQGLNKTLTAEEK